MSSDEVQAILDRRKTQHRVVVKYVNGIGPVTEFQRSDTPGYDWIMRDKRMLWNDLRDADLMSRCPFGVPGDRLYRTCPPYDAEKVSWRSPMHMPKWTARLLLEVTDVRVQRVREISIGDIDSEGYPYTPTERTAHAIGPIGVNWFVTRWDTLNAKPKPVYRTIGGRLQIDHYVSYPWQLDGGITEREYRNRKWLIYPNPWVWAITFKVAQNATEPR
jgi:hypothetical protein